MVVNVKHFVIFIAVIFLSLFVAVLNKNDDMKLQEAKPVLRVFGYASFTGQWGAGPSLKQIFEKDCDCQVQFIQGSDSGILLQRLKLEGESLGADLVVGLDQFDLQKALAEQKWRELNISDLDVYDEVKPALQNNYFVPFDWGVISFVTRKGEFEKNPENFDDLLSPNLKRKIALQDPRTSSPGMQFLSWVIRAKGEEAGFKYIKKMMEQAHSFSPSWSSAYGLFSKKQAKTALSYVTSPVFHRVEEKNNDYIALEFNEGHPVQFEFAAIPESCRNCELAERFINLMLSDQGQKLIMQKSYMFPVVRNVKEGTVFADIPQFKTLGDFEIPSTQEVERLLKKWSDLRRGDSN
ncbi:MAG: thiamine ABC transporter substrate-binding protein [Bdellovibrionaceae bacterium]|nr:thiamine ABC transporter substrate-binding protein [Pseudobdellovibrionaceae bacterium]